MNYFSVLGGDVGERRLQVAQALMTSDGVQLTIDRHHIHKQRNSELQLLFSYHFSHGQ